MPAILMPEPKEPPFAQQPPPGAMPPPVPGKTAFEGGGFVNPANTFVHGLQTGQNLAQGYENLKEQRQAFPTAQAGRDLALQEQSSNYAKQQNIRDRVSSVFQDLHDGSLNDNHVPNGQVGIGTPPSPGAPDATQGVPTSSTAGNMAPVNSPSDAPQAAIRTAASDPATQAGIPQQTPAQSGKPHSLGPEYWDGLNAKIADAAAAAGEDGPRLYEALMGQRDHFFQSQVLKNLSAANMALLNGDSKGVEQAMKNVYYYFPDGKDLDIKKGPNGELQYQDPMNPELPDGSPNMHTVDAAHLQLLGEAALDPMKVASTLAGRAAAAAEMRLKTSQAQSDLLKASAAGVTAQAALNKSNSEARRVAAQNFKDYGFGVMATARGQYYTNRLTQMALTGAFGQAIKPGDALRYQQAAVQAVGRLVNPTTISTDPISAGKMVPNPAAQPPWAKGLGSEGIANITATTQALIVNNPELGPDGNARIAAAMFRNQGMKGPDGKSLVRLSPDGGQAAVFVDGRWATVRIPPMLGASLKSGKRFVPPPTSGGTGAISTPEDDTQAAQDEQTDDNITSMGEGD